VLVYYYLLRVLKKVLTYCACTFNLQVLKQDEIYILVIIIFLIDFPFNLYNSIFFGCMTHMGQISCIFFISYLICYL
jgi:hypothetical protein